MASGLIASTPPAATAVARRLAVDRLFIGIPPKWWVQRKGLDRNRRHHSHIPRRSGNDIADTGRFVHVMKNVTYLKLGWNGRAVGNFSVDAAPNIRASAAGSTRNRAISADHHEGIAHKDYLG